MFNWFNRWFVRIFARSSDFVDFDKLHDEMNEILEVINDD